MDAKHIVQCLDSSDDFAFEMKVLNVLRTENLGKTDLTAEHGGTYVDPITGLPRQFDIRVRCRRSDCGSHSCCLKMAIECKRLQNDAPLVISRSRRIRKESTHYYIQHTFFDSASRRSPSVVVKSAGSNLTFYPFNEFVGRSATQVRSGNNSPVGDGDVYKQWSQALSSADELIWEKSSRSSVTSGLECLATLPCLVVPDGTLWTVDYDDEGNRSGPAPATTCEFYIGKPSMNRNPLDGADDKFLLTHLHIFTETGLKEFLRDRVADEDFWSDHFPTE